MAQLTIEIPDSLLEELEPLRSQLPTLLLEWATMLRASRQQVQPPTAYQEVLGFLMAQPTPEDILSFKVSESAQMRLRELLNRNREASLSEDEAFELEGYAQLDQLMQMLKIRAHSVGHQPVKD
jgi:hypothetical protein